MSSTSTPSWSATIWEKVVTCPWPWGVTPIRTRTVPVGSISIVAASQPPATYLRACRTRDGARPHISVQVEKPDPDLLVRAALAPLGLLAADVVVAQGLDHRVVGQRVVARVDRQAARDREVREAVGRDVVLAPELGRVHVQLPRQQVHRPLDRVGGLGPAGAAVGVGRRGVGVDVGVLEVVALDVVEAAVEPRAEHLDAGRDDLVVRADGAVDVHPDGLQRRRRASRPSPCRCRGRARGSWRGSPRSAPPST